MIITIKHAIDLRNFTNSLKAHKSIFGYKCLQMNKHLNEKLEKFDSDFYEKKLEFGLKGKNGEVLFESSGQRILNDEKGAKGLQDWFNLEMKKTIEVEPNITPHFEIIKDNIDAIDLCNGILVDVDIEKYLE
jgi:Zn/Cd-binding protein ZinT